MNTTDKTIATANAVKAVAATPVLPTNAAVPAAPVAVPKVAKVAPKVPAKPVTKKPVSIAKAPLKKVVKAPAKPLVKTAVKAAVKAPVKATVKASAQPKAEKPSKLKKPKLVRDSFTIPKAEYMVLDELKQRAGKLASPAKKSELIRAGVKALAAMSDVAFVAALKAVPAIKTGRPTKAKAN